MEVFTDVDADSFRLGFPIFQRPTGTRTGSEPCIAVTSLQGQRLTALYSIMVTVLFVLCWKIVSLAVMSLSASLDNPMWDPKEHREDQKRYEQVLEQHAEYLDNPAENLDQQKLNLNTHKMDLDERKKACRERFASDYYKRMLRGIALVGFWNAREPLEATCFILGYLGRAREGLHIPSPTIKLLLSAVVFLAGSYVAGIFVAAELISGNVAPANPSKVFVPGQVGAASADLMRLQALRAPATLRSLGSAEAAGDRHTIRKRVWLDPYPPSGDLQYFTYSYTVTAHDMGLQKWHDLKLEVSGQCDLNSSWFSKNILQDDLDVYRPWGLANKTVNVVYDGERKTAPSATAIPFPYKDSDFLINTKTEHRYGIIVHSSHRTSHRPGTDPWYKTEAFTPKENDTDAQIADQAGNRVMGGRPALSCKQNDTWSYEGTRFKNIYELTDEANIKFPDGWVTQLQMDFAVPRIIDVINSAGSSSLVSSTTFVGGVFDAQTSTILTDMTRLFTATWISSAYTFRNMLMVGDSQSFINAARNGAKQPQDGVDLFVVSTPQVATLRLSVLFAIPGLLVFFWLVLWILTYWCRDEKWYKNIHFAEGAYLYARTQDPETFQDIERLGEVVKKCKAKKNNINPGPGAVPPADGIALVNIRNPLL